MATRLSRVLVVLSIIALASGCSWITRASVDQDGNDPSNGSTNPSLSASGHFVAFESAANDLVPDDTNGEIDVFVRDVRSGLTTRASVDSDEKQFITLDADAPTELLFIAVTVPGPGPGSYLPGTTTLAPESPTIT